MTIRFAFLNKITSFIGAIVVLSLAAGCGKVENADDRTRGSDNINVRPQKVGASDAKGKKGDKPADGTVDPSDGTSGPVDPAASDVQRLMTSAGLRNYEQINATMATVTGVPMTTAAVKDMFANQLATSLPTDNDIKAFLGSQQVAVYKLAVTYCETLVTSATLRTKVFGTFNFAGTPNVSLNAAGKDLIAEALVTKFWGVGLESLPDHDASVDTVVALIDSLLVGKSATTATVTPVVVTGACSAVLAAAPVTIL